MTDAGRADARRAHCAQAPRGGPVPPLMPLPVEVSVHVALAGGMGVQIASRELDLGDLVAAGPGRIGEGADGLPVLRLPVELTGTAAALERIAQALTGIGRGMYAAARAGRLDEVTGAGDLAGDAGEAAGGRPGDGAAAPTP